MPRFLIYYGPRDEFERCIPNRYYPLEMLVRLSDLTKGLPKIDFDEVVGFSMSYSSITEGGIQNFCTILDLARDALKTVYLQNPPDCIKDEIERSYLSDDIEIRYHKYKKIGKKQIRKINQNFNDVIIGQTDVKEHLLAVLYELYSGRNKNLPIVLMFYGPSGVGKTETAKYLSKLMGGDLLRQQMSMYQTQSFFDYLYGADHNRGSFAKDLLERKSNIVLLDEFDKAHPGIWSAFYQMFDEGQYKDRNYTVDLKNTVFVCTSNSLSPDEIRKQIGDPLYYRFNGYIQFKELDQKSKEEMVRRIVHEEYSKLRREEKIIIDEQTLLNRYIIGISSYKNYRHARNLIKNDLNKMLLPRLLN